ncbi:UNVERIFIED_CONTAM: hypothetical protein FKN15_025651 [Acipenser sinensis]
MNTRCPPKRVPSAARFFTLCRLTVQPPQSYSVGGQRSSGQLTGKPAGARPDYRDRWCAKSQYSFIETAMRVTVEEGLPTASEFDTFENVTVFDRLSSNGCCSIEIEYPEELSSAKARKNYKDRVLRESLETLIANYSTVDNCRVKCNLLLYTEHPSAWHSALCSTYCNILHICVFFFHALFNAIDPPTPPLTSTTHAPTRAAYCFHDDSSKPSLSIELLRGKVCIRSGSALTREVMSDQEDGEEGLTEEQEEEQVEEVPALRDSEQEGVKKEGQEGEEEEEEEEEVKPEEEEVKSLTQSLCVGSASCVLAQVVECPLSVEMVAEGLSLLCKVGNGLGHAYTRLDVKERGVTELSALAPFIHIRFLDVSQNQLRDLSPLTSLTHLLWIKADGNQLTGFKGQPLGELPYLQWLSLASNKIRGLEGLGGAVLEYLNLTGNLIQQVSGLDYGCLSNLVCLELRGNQLESTEGLHLPNLRHLYLNLIKRLEGLAHLEKLTTLHLRDNQLESLQGFSAGMRALQYLNLRGNLVFSLAEVRALVPLSGSLRALVLSENPLSESEDYRLSVLGILPHLERLDKDPVNREEREEAEQREKVRGERRGGAESR